MLFVTYLRHSLLFLYLALIPACASGLLREETLKNFNEKLRKKHFEARKNIYPPFAGLGPKKLLFSKGSKLRIVVQQSEDWVKVRAFPLHEKEEQRRGKLILFISREFLKPEEQTHSSVALLIKKSIGNLLKETSFSGR